MNFPKLVYRCPGNHQRPGGTFDYRQVATLEQLEAAVQDGWYPSLPQAIVKGEADLSSLSLPDVEVTTDEADDELPPTRKELEAKAKELKISFNKNTKDETLAEKIEAVSAEG